MNRYTICTLTCVLLAFFSCSCNNTEEVPGAGTDEPQKFIRDDFELSYWVDMDCIGNHFRGYWYDPAGSAADPVTPEEFVKNTAHQLAVTYKANKLYVIYHRQYEMEAAKTVFGYWKKWGDEYGMEIVPTIVVQNYSKNETLNFTDEELEALSLWCMENICRGEVGIYDVYTRDQTGKIQDRQLEKLSGKIGNVYVRVGMQPGVVLRPYYKFAVQDTWTAECQGQTNSLWEFPRDYLGSTNYGRNLLVNWVKERTGNASEPRKWVWNLIPVAWDYEDLTDNPYSYKCPGDNALTNDPPVPGRLELCEKYITGCYDGGLGNSKFGGYSCDLHILHANSAGCQKDKLPFYNALRIDQEYTGYFSEAMSEIASIYERIANDLK